MRLYPATILLGLAVAVLGCKGPRSCDCVPPPSLSALAPAAPMSPPPFVAAPATLPPSDPDAPRLQPAPVPAKPSSLTVWGR